MSRVARIIAAVAVVLTAVAACGCAVSGGTSADAESPSSGSATRTVSPGINEWADGTVEASGYVLWEDLEGGFWTIKDGPATVAGTKQPKIVAVLLPGSASEQLISSFNGAYAVVGGRVQGGASIRMAGPEIMVDTIAPALPPGN